jgi:predicted amidohydrolase
LKLRVAGAQIPVGEDIAANTNAIVGAIEFAAEEKADVLLTPEGSLSGYTDSFDQAAAARALEEVTGRAREAGVGLALGTCFVESDGRCYNQIRFYDREGGHLGFHSKTLTCGTWDEPPQGEINSYAVAPLRTFAMNGITVGGLICNDVWANPCCTPMPDTHLTQQLAKMGARVVFHAVNGGRGDDEWREVAWQFHESNLRMRASAGRLWIVTVDNCYPMELNCSAPGGVIDPGGSWVVRTPRRGMHFFAHTIEVAM